MEALPPQNHRAILWTRCFVVFGLALRAFHYFRNPSMWHDEAALVLNVLGKDFRELLGPLFYAEAAPPLFLWIERAMVLVLGDGTYALRLVPFLASCAGLILLVPVARKILEPANVPSAVLLFACSDHLLWHACEAKPYAVDALAAVVVLALYCLTDTWSFAWRIVLFSVAAPLLLFLAYPGSFLYGGLLMALLPAVWRQRQLSGWLGLAALGVVVLVAFAFLLAGPIHAQRHPDMDQCWQGAFPNWNRPWTVPLWTTLSTFEVLRYCCEPVGQVLLLPFLLGIRSLWRRGQRELVLLLGIPILLPLIASFAKAYPYGGARVLVYATPALVLCIAEGVPRCIALGMQLRSWLTARGSRFWLPSSSLSARLAYWCAAAIFLAPVGRAVQRVVSPWQRADCAAAAAYVLVHRQPGEEIISNHWEYAYYFRHLGHDFSLENHPPRSNEHRLWVVATAGTWPERESVLDAVRPGDWRVAEQHDFPLSSVFLLSRLAEK